VNASGLLTHWAAERPEAPAIIEGPGPRSLTFRALDIGASSIAGQLRRRGMGPGDVVLVLIPMSANLYIVLAALLRLGAVAMFPDPASDVDEIDRSCRISPPAAFIGSPKAHVLRLLSRSVRLIPLKFSTRGLVPGAVTLRAERPEASSMPSTPGGEDTPALITFTSGSTGTPKAALRTHGFLLAQQRVLAETLELTPGDVDLATLPIFVLANLAAGVTSIIPDANLRRPGAIDPGPVLAQIRRFRPNRASGSPAFFERLVEGARTASCTLDSFGRVYTGGAPVFPGLLDRIAGVAPLARVTAVYGSTEAEPIAHVERSQIRTADRDAMIRGRGLLAGAASPSVRLAILPDRWGHALPAMTAGEFAASCLPAEGRGEIVVSGAHVLKHYLHGAGEEETKFRVGGEIWHRTGDAGWLDAEQRLWLLGRCAARLTDSRGELYPFSVECAAVETLGVRRAAALAWRGRRTLVLELSGNLPRPDLSQLAGPLEWAGLDEIRFVPRIPVDRRHNAKVDYGALERLLDANQGNASPRTATTTPTSTR
jgi:acyl-CoA synthetase (AMP-forming)/AMP-acid ligase II